MSNTGHMFSRRRDLDVTRELIVASLIFFHTAGIFGDFDFYVKNDTSEPVATFVIILTSFWGIPLLFVIAGFAICNSLHKRTLMAFVHERLLRLLIPLIVGLLAIVPPQIYYALRSDPAYHEPYAQFYPRFLDITLKADFPWFFSAAPTSNLFQPAHLWFLYILLLFTFLLLPVFIYLQKTSGRKLVGRIASFSTGPWAMVLAAFPIAVIEAALGTEMSGGWNHSAYIVFLFYGYLLAADVRFWQSLCKYWKISLAFASVGSVAGIIGFYLIAESSHTDPLHAYDATSVMIRFFKGMVGWSWIVAILGFLEDAKRKRQSARYSREPSVTAYNRTFLAGVERYANKAVLPFYVLHQTVIVAIGFYIVQWNISVTLKFLAISLTSLAMTLFLYEIVIRRTRVTRFLFGMKSETVY